MNICKMLSTCAIVLSMIALVSSPPAANAQLPIFGGPPCGDVHSAGVASARIADTFCSHTTARPYTRLLELIAPPEVAPVPEAPFYCFDPARPPTPEVMAAINLAMAPHLTNRYSPAARWPGPEGSPLTLTWSLVPDGTLTPGLPGAPDAPNNLFAQMDAKFAGQGGRAAWIAQVQACFDRWAQVTGTTYTRVRFSGAEWDDGAPFGTGALPGSRGDVRIFGRNIDGVGGGVLAFAFMPGNGGDMVLDTAEDFGSPGNNFRFFRNTVMHEHGHTLGMPHMCSANSRQLMEPFLDLVIDGPQHDDIRSGHRHYGDAFEPNDSLVAATDLGVLTIGQTANPSPIPGLAIASTLTALSVDGDADYFRFTINAPTRIDVDCFPQGFPYDDNAQAIDGSCFTGVVTNSREQADLAYSVLDATGVVLLTVNNGGLGQPEASPIPLNLGVAGEYYVRVSAVGTVPQTQNYDFRIRPTVGCPTPVASPAAQVLCQGATATFTVSGTAPVPVGWQRNGVNIPGANSTTLILNPVTVANSGTYTCYADTQCGRLFSNAITLTVFSGVPAITTQPISQLLCPSQSATLTISATEATSYQWRQSGASIAGATASSYTTSVPGSYDCVVSNFCGSVPSNTATLTAAGVPVITRQPNPQTFCVGQAAFISVLATGQQLSFQWYRNDTLIPGNEQIIPGATSNVYTIPSMAQSNAGAYFCRVSNACGSVDTRTVLLGYATAPSVSTQPESQTVCSGRVFSFVALATSTPQPSYQWRRNGVNVPGATSAFYSALASAATAGTYSCVMSTQCGSVTTSSAVLTVNTSPSITANPAPQSACEGGPASFSITATGGDLTYQWRRSGTNIPGATSATYSIAAVSEVNLGTYDCVVTNPCSTTTSSAAAITLNSVPSITGNSTALAVCEGGPASFSVTATGSASLTYQWRVGGVNIAGATSATYLIASVSTNAEGAYDCVVTNTCGSTTSNLATLTVNSPPTIIGQPASVNACPSAIATLSVAVADAAPAYQWQIESTFVPGTWIDLVNGQTLPGCGLSVDAGATLGTLAIQTGPNASGQNCSGRFRCIVTSTCGSVTSDPATLTLCPADFNCSGNITVQDLFDFLAAYFSNNLIADFNGSGTIGVQDLFDFLAAYFAGC